MKKGKPQFNVREDDPWTISKTALLTDVFDQADVKEKVEEKDCDLA